MTSAKPKLGKDRAKLKTNRRFASFKSNAEFFLLCLPGLLYFFVFHYLPMGGILIAFKEYNYKLGIFGSKWIGLKNFEFFFLSQDAWRITRNTVGYSFLFMLTGMFSAVLVALLLNELKNKSLIKYYQTTMILPHFLSWVIVAFITFIMLNPAYGVLNKALISLGFEERQWYSEFKYWPPILTISNVWKHVGMSSVIYYSSLMGADKEMYEAATIDGAGRFKQAIYISIPFLVPIMTIMLILNLGNVFRGDFGLFYQVPRDIGALYPATDIIDTYVYRGLFSGSIGMASAVGFFQSFIGLFMVAVSNQIIRKINPENSLY
ncbi:MAG: ABC transporter permease subunit [Firmicutes bacterium]|nr:ABC transporter permease subunit [Bacillota bacterium]